MKKIKKLLFKDYSTDIALRYLPVIDLIKQYELKDREILEIGSGDQGISPYLKEKITGLDVRFVEPENNLIKKIKYDGKNFPFINNKFDIALSVDSLEHIERDSRQKLINEIFRVTKEAFILVVPCGQAAYEHDKRINDYYVKMNKKRDKYLDDHVNNGLPEKDEIRQMIKKASDKYNKKIELIFSKKLLNMKIRYFFMKCHISGNYFLKILYYLFLLFLPIKNFFNFGRCYRQLFFIKILNN